MNASKDTIQSVERTIEVIKVMSCVKDGISLTQLSKSVDLHKATISRILKTLKLKGLVEQNPENLKYSLGTGFLEISLNYLESMDLRKIALPYMRVLQEKTGETVNLAILDNFEVIYIERIDSKQDLRHSISVGKRAPAYCTSLGKSILAFSDPKFVHQKLHQTHLEKLTDSTVVDPEKIIETLNEVRKNGFAFDDKEHQKHIRCTGSPIFKSDGKVIGAISISGPEMRMDLETIERFSEYVKSTASLISAELGWQNNS